MVRRNRLSANKKGVPLLISREMWFTWSGNSKGPRTLFCITPPVIGWGWDRVSLILTTWEHSEGGRLTKSTANLVSHRVLFLVTVVYGARD